MAVDAHKLTLVSQWNVRGRPPISLFLNERSKFAYSIANTNPEPILPYLYSNDRRTRVIIDLFRDVIAENLRKSVTSSSFVPVFESRVCIKRGEEYVPLDKLNVALFGQGNPETKEILDARWGIYNETDDSTAIVEIDTSHMEDSVRKCLVNVLCHKQTPKLYSSEYVMALATLNAKGKIQSIALKVLGQKTSLYNENLPLDENHWAITLISVQSGITSNEQGTGGDSGHAMIACEGVKDGRPFLTYMHLTKKKGDVQARIETITGFIDALHGPTWVRTKAAVENMFRPIQEAAQRNQHLPFMPGRQIPALIAPPLAAASITGGVVALGFVAAAVISSSIFAPMCPAMSFYIITQVATRAVMSSLGTVAAASFTGGIGALYFRIAGHRYDCLRWTIEQLPAGGIRLQIPSTLFTPNGVVQYLNNHPDAAKLDG